MTISDEVSNSLFNAIQYCIDNNIQCFTFKMNKTKKVNVVWKNITSDNMIDYINFEDNGFAVITGAEYIVIDYDEKHNPPKSILTILIDNCNAVEKTPGGYHFWYKADKRTGHFKSGVNIKWNNSEVVGLDIRAKGGIIYTSPSYYYDGDIIKKYSWIKGDLSTATPMPSLILEYLTASDLSYNDHLMQYNLDSASISTYSENNKQIIKIVPKGKECLVKKGHIHSNDGHSCIYITKKKSGFVGVKSCFSHGKEKLSKEDCDTIIEYYWEGDNNDDNTLITEYSTIKDDFEKINFKIKDPVGFYSNIGGEWRFYERNNFKILHENLLLSDNKSFIDLWLKDPTIKIYDKVGFFPNVNECPETIFNLFKPFVASTITNISNISEISLLHDYTDTNTDTSYLQHVLNHIKLLVNDDDECYEFLLDWFADIIQNPSKINGVAVIINGQHGCGKDLLISWYATHILGMHLCYRTARPQKDIFDTFNSARLNKLLIHVEEANKFVIDNVNVEEFKSMITCPHWSNRKMRQDVEKNDINYNRFILSTNNSDPLRIDETERRFFAVRASSAKCNNMEYFTGLLNIMSMSSVKKSFYDLLATRDISKRNWLKIPQTDYLRSAKLSNICNVYHFLHSLLQDNDDDFLKFTRSLYVEYNNWCKPQKNCIPISETEFGIELKNIDGCQKIRNKKGIQCSFIMKEVCLFLQKKGFECSCGKCMV